MTATADLPGAFASLVASGQVPSIAYAIVADSDVTVDAVGPVTVDSLFEIGSVTKAFTGLLLADLVAGGTVRLADRAGSYLPGGVDSPVTLLQLATHTSGLPRLPPGFWPRALLHPGDPYAGYRESRLLRAARRSLAAAVGTAGAAPYSYSNFGYGLLGYLLGRAAGEPYEALVADRLTGPLGLTSTTFGGQPVPGTKRGRPVPPWHLGALSGCGGLRSTATDLASLLVACLEPSSVFGLSFEPRAVIGPAAAIGLGWHHQHGVIWHNGMTGGFSAMVAFNPSGRLGIAALTNAAGQPPSPIERPIMEAVTG
jgi:D-alanyl-D-alanine-carboxypeptidase/D-alanyl-D-alanine-endopeptidase